MANPEIAIGGPPPTADRTPRKPARSGRRRRSRLVVLGCQIALVFVLLGLWQLAVDHGLVSAFLYGSPATIFAGLMTTVNDGTIWNDTWLTGS
ncbi:MAG TPA: hypothetical protein VL356_01970, partial [Acidocella sp.]|nr:hypothetical protein [Acidocella sp.]